MPRPLMTALWPLFSAALLTACGTPEVRTVPVVKIERQKIPAGLLTCDPAPAVPVAETQRQVAAYVVDLWAAGEDCRVKLGKVRGLVTAPE